MTHRCVRCLDEGALETETGAAVRADPTLVEVALGLLAVIAARRGLLAPGFACQQAAQLVAAEVWGHGRVRCEVAAVVIRELWLDRDRVDAVAVHDPLEHARDALEPVGPRCCFGRSHQTGPPQIRGVGKVHACVCAL